MKKRFRDYYYQCATHRYGTNDGRKWQEHQHNKDTRDGSYACDHCSNPIEFKDLPGNIAPRKKCKKCGRFTRIPALRLPYPPTPYAISLRFKRYRSSHRVA